MAGWERPPPAGSRNRRYLYCSHLIILTFLHRRLPVCFNYGEFHATLWLLCNKIIHREIHMAFIVAPRVARVGGFARVGLVGFLGCLAGCGGGHGGGSTPVTYTISGTLTGLAPGEQVTFTNNGADSLLVASDGTFTFKVAMAQS